MSQWIVRVVRVLLASYGFLCLPDPAWAQGTAAALSGTVKDQSGGAVPGVSVTIRNTDTSLTRQLVTDDNGHFAAPSLPPGPYEVTAALSGFATLVRGGITLTVGQESVANLTLTVSQLEDRIEVFSDAPTVDITSGSTGTLVAAEQITNLPLNGRSYIELATLSPGAQLTDTGGQGESTGYGAKLSVHGSRYTANLFTLDGTSLNDQFSQAGSASGNVLGVEAVREFRVQTNSFSAEFGRHTGAVINAATKSGTNAVHGSLFEFHRNDAFDARNFFDNPANLPNFTRNQFGFSIGGPIQRDKMFFFGTYEGLEEDLGRTVNYTVPSAAVRDGVVHPAIRPYLLAYPMSNGRALDAQRGEYLQLDVRDTSEHYAMFRLDRQFGPKSQVFFRYTYDKAVVINPGLTTINEQNTKVRVLTAEHTWVASARFLNRTQFGLTLSDLNSFDEVREGITLPRSTFTDFVDRGVLAISVTGLTALGGSNTNPKLNTFRNYQFNNTSTFLLGKHSVKAGVSIELLQYPLTSAQTAYGQYTFRSVNDFVTNVPNTFASMLPGSDMTRDLRQRVYGLFLQDDIRLTSTFTVNAGVRYEPTSGVTETEGRLAQLLDPFSPTARAQDTVVLDELYRNPTRSNLAPRLGFAWDVRGDGKTAIRGGVGTFYDLITLGSPFVQNTTVRVPPFIARGEIVRTATPGGINFPDAYTTQASLLRAQATMEALQYDVDQPTMYKYNLNLQRELPGRMALELGYTGTRGVNLVRMTYTNGRLAVPDANGRLYVPQGRAAPLIQPNFGRARARTSDSTSDYHGLTAGLSRRGAAWQTQVSYTFSKAIDEGGSPLGGNDFEQEPGGSRYLTERDRGLTPFDTRHSLVANVNYSLPFGKDRPGVLGALIKNWNTGLLLRLRTGYPFSVFAGTDQGVQEFTPLDYPDLAPGADNNPIRGGHEQYFDPTAFVLQPLGYIGNLGRNTLIGPGFATVDLQVSRDLRFGSSHALQLRIEAFNLFNRVNLGLPSQTLFDGSGNRLSTAGRITTTASPARQMQLGVRYVF